MLRHVHFQVPGEEKKGCLQLSVADIKLCIATAIKDFHFFRPLNYNVCQLSRELGWPDLISR